MKAGLLDRRLRIEEKPVEDPSGWGSPEPGPLRATVWAQRIYVSEDIQTTDENTNHFEIVTFRIRYRSDVEQTDILICEGENYKIHGIREIGRREGLEIKAKAYPANAQI